MKDKGFSMVEMIIVIAIMAILAVALAPQLMKYIDKSRHSVDNNNCQSLITTVNATLGNDEAYKEVIAAAESGIVSFKINGTKPTGYVGITSTGKFSKEFEGMINNWPKVKQSGDLVYQVTISVNEEDKRVLDVNAKVVPK